MSLKENSKKLSIGIRVEIWLILCPPLFRGAIFFNKERFDYLLKKIIAKYLVFKAGLQMTL